jgi:hypothetical protein
MCEGEIGTYGTIFGPEIQYELVNWEIAVYCQLKRRWDNLTFPRRPLEKRACGNHLADAARSILRRPGSACELPPRSMDILTWTRGNIFPSYARDPGFGWGRATSWRGAWWSWN